VCSAAESRERSRNGRGEGEAERERSERDDGQQQFGQRTGGDERIGRGAVFYFIGETFPKSEIKSQNFEN